MIASTAPFALPAEAAAPAERQLHDAVHRQPVRSVLGGDDLARLRIGRIQEIDLLREAREGVVGADRVARGKAPLEARLQRVVPRLAFVGGRVDGIELRIGAKQPLALDVRAAEVRDGRDRQQVEERVRHVLAQIIDPRLIADRARAQVLQRVRVQIPVRLDLRAAVAYVGDLGDPASRQLALDAHLPALHPRRERTGIEERDALAHERLRARAPRRPAPGCRPGKDWTASR